MEEVDKENIKAALKACTSEPSDCNNCPYKNVGGWMGCVDSPLSATLELINSEEE